jgi:hypothetical protein
MNPILSSATLGFSKAAKLCAGSAGSFFVANAMPEESIFKIASGVTGWALAIVCIWVLSKTVRALFDKLEAKDDLIRSILEKERDELKHELDSIDSPK